MYGFIGLYGFYANVENVGLFLQRNEERARTSSECLGFVAEREEEEGFFFVCFIFVFILFLFLFLFFFFFLVLFCFCYVL